MILQQTSEFVRAADSTPGLRMRTLHPVMQQLFFLTSPIRKKLLVKGLHYSFRSEGLDVRIKIDEIRMRQIITNLAENAVRYTQIGFVEIYVSIQNNNKLVISFKDTGIGMSKAATSRVSKLLYEKKKGHLLNPQGLGLGLAIVQSHLLDIGGEMIFNLRCRLEPKLIFVCHFRIYLTFLAQNRFKLLDNN